MEYTAEKVKSISALSTAFTDADTMINVYYMESVVSSFIREVTYKDVTSKHFIGWFFSLRDWVGTDPKKFPFDMLVHDDEKSVYGYFNGDDLDGIIRVDVEGSHCELSFFSVNKSLHNRGIGQLLFRHTLSRFKNMKMKLSVYTNKHSAIHIYRKYGFKIAGSGYDKGFNPGLLHFVMAREVQ